MQGYTKCYTDPSASSSEKAHALLVSDVAMELVTFATANPSVVDAFKLWQNLFALLDQIPSREEMDTVKVIVEAVKRLKALMGIAARVYIKKVIDESDNFQMVTDQLNKDFSCEPFPKNLQMVLVTVSKAKELTAYIEKLEHQGLGGA